MTRTIQIIIGIALLINIASAATQGVTLSDTAFPSKFSKVFDGSPSAADTTTWGNGYQSALFGPGTDNTTVYAYGVQFTASTSIDKVISRKINASLVSNGTADTNLASKMGDDVTSSASITTTSAALKTAVGLGSMAIAYVATTGTGATACNHVFLAVYNGGTGAPIANTQVTKYTCSVCTGGTAGTGVGYTVTVNDVFYSNNTYYVAYTYTSYTETETNPTSITCSGTPPTAKTAASKQLVVSALQGVAATSTGTLQYTTVPAIYTGTLTAVNTNPSPAATDLTVRCGPSNYSNTSTSYYCTYRNGAASPATVSLVTVSNGTAGSATTIATDVAASGAYPQTATVYTVAGFVHSPYQAGVLLNKGDTIVSAQTGGTTTYANTLQVYNLTSGATATAGGTALSTSITNTQNGGAYTAEGIAYLTGFGIVDSYVSGSAATTFERSGWLANGTANVTKATYATGTALLFTSNYFLDSTGALWAGAYTYDDANNKLLTGSLGKMIASTYPTSTFGVVLSSFFALISFVVAVLFAF